eukprot:Skav224169  [mRNA]  locus=scaffold2007:357728:362942:+ [translate_table: standard]
MALKLASMVVLGLSMATNEFMADDECSDSSCALNALQLKKHQETAAVASEEGCHDIKEGEGGPCWEAIMWAKNVGMPNHPNWYPGMTEDSPLSEFQFVSWNTTHPKCPRPCNVPAPGSWCRNAAPPTLWRPSAAGASINIKVLSYNLFWWHLFKVEGGRGGSAGRLIRSTSEPPYDVMGFQECENPERVLGPAGMLQEYEFFQGNHAICMAFRKETWSLLVKGETDVAEDMRTEYYGTRGTQWMRLQHKASGRHLFFVNHHGPLSVNSGGLCGGQATAYNILQIMAKNAQVGDVLVLVGDFNANAASRTLQSLWGHLHAVYNSKSFGGVDNILANVGKNDVLIGEEIGSGGSDHQAISAIISVGGEAGGDAPARKAKSLHIPCQTAKQGSSCWNEVQWAMSSGIHSHPEWYPGLTANSGREEFQELVHQNNPRKCPLPCGVPLGGSLGAASASGTSFSVEVLEEAQGSDACLLEPQTEYEVDGWSEVHKHVSDPRVCCQKCEHHGGCKAWVWSEWNEGAHGMACVLKGGQLKNKIYKDGAVSGLPKAEAIKEAERAMAKNAAMQNW